MFFENLEGFRRVISFFFFFNRGFLVVLNLKKLGLHGFPGFASLVIFVHFGPY